MDNTQIQFDQAYWASQPPEVRGLPGIADLAQREQRAAVLATKGFTIDVPIMVWWWDAYLTMLLRWQLGYKWVPSALQPSVVVIPGIPAWPPLTAYDPAHPPAGSIAVPDMSQPIDKLTAQYPPYDTPAPNPQPPAAIEDPVGLQSVGNLYLCVAGETYSDGAKYTDTRGTFLKHVAITPFGRSTWWEKIA